MMRKKCALVLVSILLIFAMLFGGCINNPMQLGTNYLIKVPDFTSKYTEEEHLNRIKTAVMNFYSKDDFLWGEFSYKICDCVVYIVYSFDNKPEYFLVELISKSINNLSQEDYYAYGYLMGFIMEDRYYNYLIYTNLKSGHEYGQSPYAKNGLLNNKKYIGQDPYNWMFCMAYEQDGVIYGNEDSNRSEEPLSPENVSILNKDLSIYVEKERDVREFREIK